MQLVATRRGRITEADWPCIRDVLDVLPIDVDPASNNRVLDIVPSVASEHDLSVYDAIYLELALRLGLPLATPDKKLDAAAKAAGVKTLGL